MVEMDDRILWIIWMSGELKSENVNDQMSKKGIQKIRTFEKFLNRPKKFWVNKFHWNCCMVTVGSLVYWTMKIVCRIAMTSTKHRNRNELVTGILSLTLQHCIKYTHIHILKKKRAKTFPTDEFLFSILVDEQTAINET